MLFRSAQTDAQKQAVLAFKTAVTSARDARWTAIHAALFAFQSGIDQAIAARKTGVENAIIAFKGAVDAAIAKAKADCAGGIDAATVRGVLQTSVKAAQDAFRATTTGLDKVKTSLDSLIAIRRAAVEKAQGDFKTALEKAIADLRVAFPGENNNQRGTQ